MTPRVAKPAARWIGVFWIILAVGASFPNPLVGKGSLIGADAGISAGHGVLGLFLLLMSFTGESTCAFALYAGCATCLTFAGYVLWQLGSYDSLQLFSGVFATRSAEYLHLAAGVTMGIFGKLNTARNQLFKE